MNTPPRVIVVANQKGGVGKTTTAMNLAAVIHACLCTADDQQSPVLVVSTDPQRSAEEYASRGGDNLPFDFTQETDPANLAKLRLVAGYRVIIVDTPGSLENQHILVAAMDQADFVVVPVLPEAMSYGPTATTIHNVITPRDLPYLVVINSWDARDGVRDRDQTRQWLDRNNFTVAHTCIRRYKMHAQAAVNGTVVTQYPKGRTATECRLDYTGLAMELGFAGAVTLAVA